MSKKVLAVVLGAAAVIFLGSGVALVIRRNKHREEDPEYVESDIIEEATPAEDRFKIVNSEKTEVPSEIEYNVIVPNVNGDVKLEDLVQRYSGENSICFISEDEYKAAPYDDQYELQYFVDDDILCWATNMEEILHDDDIYVAGVPELSDHEVVWMTDGHRFYELSQTSENYLEVYQDVVGGLPDPNDIHFLVEEEKEDEG